MFFGACGSDSGSFKIDGQLIGINQGEFHVYSPDGIIDGLDTIFVTAGRFHYKTPCDHEGTLVVVFPNFSSQPIFASPGKSVKISGDASHLKELKATGTKENRLMNAFREQVKDLSLDDTKKRVEEFVGAHPETSVAVYLVDKYFIATDAPDYSTAAGLLLLALEAQPRNGLLATKAKNVSLRATTDVGKRLPHFVAIDLDGDTITEKNYSTGDAIIYLWASYEYPSIDLQRTLAGQFDGVELLGLSVDADVTAARKALDRDNVSSRIVCDERAFFSPLVEQLSLTNIPDNIVVHDGTIVARNMTLQELRERFNKKR